jgi:hypothetical protein
MEWRDVAGHEGRLKVSDTGELMSVTTGAIRKTRVDRYGYEILTLRKGEQTKTELVHRLVAKAFIDNPNGYPQINHKDENKRNNAVSNLEWCTQEYNLSYGRPGNWHFPRPVACLTNDGARVATYPGVRAASRAAGVATSTISKCCRGARRSAAGYKWQYA